MLPLILLLWSQSALEAADAANGRLVRCYFSVVRANAELVDAASLERKLSQGCSAEEAAMRVAGQRRMREMGRTAGEAGEEVDRLIRSVRSGLAAQTVRFRTQKSL